MEIRLPEVQAALDGLRHDPQIIKKPHVLAAIEQLDTMLGQLELKSKPVAGGLAAKTDTEQLESLTASIMEIIENTANKAPFFNLLHRIAITYRSLGEPERAANICEQILTATEEGAYPYIRAEAFRQLGIRQFYQGNWEQAKTYYEQSLLLFEAEDDHGYIATIHNNLGYIAVQQGDYALAKQHHHQAITFAEAHSEHRRILAAAYNSLGVIASVQANWNEAVDDFEKSIEIYEALSLPREGAGVYMNLAMAYADAQAWEAAGECYAEATVLAEKSGNLLTLSKIYVNRAEFFLNMANIDAARLYGEKALTIFQNSGDNIGIADVYKLYGRIHRYQKEWERAIEVFTQSLLIYQSCNNLQGSAEACYEFGMMYKDYQDVSQARHYLQRAHNLYAQLGAAEEMTRVETALGALEANRDGVSPAERSSLAAQTVTP